MKSRLFIPTLFIIVTIFSVIFGSDFVTSWKSFLLGMLFALSVRDVGEEVLKRATRR